jgi:hypothetical protein
MGAAVALYFSGIGLAQLPPSPPVGSYEGRLPFYAKFPDDSHLTNGYLSLKASAKGALSGTVALSGFVYRIPRGTLIGSGGTTPGVIEMTHRTGPPVELEITEANEFEISGRVNRVGEAPIEFGGMAGHALQVLEIYSTKNPFPFAGLYTLGLESYQSDYNAPDSMDLSGDHGYGLLKIATSGRTMLRGRLPDGTTYTSSTSSRADFYGFDGWVYAPILRGAGSVVGPIFKEFAMMPLPVTLLGSGFEGWRWYVNDAVQPPANRTSIDVYGSEYTPPAMGDPILLGGQHATNVKQGVIPGISPLGIDARDLAGPLPGAPDPLLRPAPKYLATVTNPNSLPTEVTFQFNPKNGSYRANFIHPATGRVKTAWGAVVQWDGVYESHYPNGGGGSYGMLIGVEPGGHIGVFVNKVRQPDKSSITYPGWLFHDIPGN